MITQDNTEGLIQEVKDRLMDGIELAVSRHARILQYLVSTAVTKDGKGKVVGRSEVGEFPRMETGQLHDNIAYGVDRYALEGRVGVKGRNTNEPNLHSLRDPRLSFRPNEENIGGLAIVALEESKGRRGLRASFEIYAQGIGGMAQSIKEGAAR
jgi:hypothetical protein